MFIPEVLLSARTMQACLDVLEPQITTADRHSFGTVVLATVEGDVHDIGKNTVDLMLESSGFTVVNLGMSAQPATTMPRMPEVIAAPKEAGPRDQVKVPRGGPPVSQRYAQEIGADGFGANPVFAVERAGELMSARIDT